MPVSRYPKIDAIIYRKSSNGKLLSYSLGTIMTPFTSPPPSKQLTPTALRFFQRSSTSGSMSLWAPCCTRYQCLLAPTGWANWLLAMVLLLLVRSCEDCVSSTIQEKFRGFVSYNIRSSEVYCLPTVYNKEVIWLSSP